MLNVYLLFPLHVCFLSVTNISFNNMTDPTDVSYKPCEMSVQSYLVEAEINRMCVIHISALTHISDNIITCC